MEVPSNLIPGPIFGCYRNHKVAMVLHLMSNKLDVMMDDFSSETTLVNTPGLNTPQESHSSTKNVASKAIEKIESVVLYAFHQSPLYQRDNQYILSGYRGELNSLKRCLDSLWYVHNETGNYSPVLC